MKTTTKNIGHSLRFLSSLSSFLVLPFSTSPAPGRSNRLRGVHDHDAEDAQGSESHHRDRPATVQGGETGVTKAEGPFLLFVRFWPTGLARQVAEAMPTGGRAVSRCFTVRQCAQTVSAPCPHGGLRKKPERKEMRCAPRKLQTRGLSCPRPCVAMTKSCRGFCCPLRTARMLLPTWHEKSKHVLVWISALSIVPNSHPLCASKPRFGLDSNAWWA